MTVVVVGSSGGGAATLGHDNIVELLTTIHNQLQKIKRTNKQPQKDSPASTSATSSASKLTSATTSTSNSSAVKQYHGIRFAIFVSLHGGKGLDSAIPTSDRATLWTVGFDDQLKNLKEYNKNEHDNHDNLLFQVRPMYTGLLHDVNIKAKELEQNILSPFILSGNMNHHQHQHSPIKGMILISCDPNSVNQLSISAAAKCGIPVTGTGGTSLGIAATTHKGLKLVGNAGGSVATTTYTRAVSYCHALATVWEEDYNPFQNNNNYHQNENENEDNSSSSSSSNKVKPHIGSVLDACLPSFLGVCLACHLLTFVKDNNNNNMLISNDNIELIGSSIDQLITQLKYQALPMVCAVITASTYNPEYGSIAIMAAGVASAGCWGSIFCGLLSGWLVSLMLGRVLFTCIKLKIPATMTNIIVGGCLGAMIAIMLNMTGIASLLRWSTETIRTLVRFRPTFGPWDGTGYGFLLGCMFCYGSKVGWYHRFFLPIILIEMEHGDASLFGAIDECTLVIVSAGICAANIISSSLSSRSQSQPQRQEEEHISVCKRGIVINILFGDFIEVAYPFMEQCQIVNLSAYLASGFATEILYGNDSTSFVLSSAYLPFFLSVVLAKSEWVRMLLAILVAFGISFLGMLFSTLRRRIQGRPTFSSNEETIKKGS